ncbi:hypothetical protein B4U37_07275 [Sutcliffiella horikoshii]|uniref:DUF2642 domain-containing protein n=1 Tax=Sutcliffiella horikoshii TaxID=79883 RepID=A0ABM6KH03_9BACI|nr:hypothetical protein [Sutcliffiella horikoshii]ART75842.1 hypothetical protein B4U37_07275 [Sutcliffiella horikoshii]
MGVLYVESSREGCGCFKCSTRGNSSESKCKPNSTTRSLEERVAILEGLVARNAQLIAENRRLITQLENGDAVSPEVREFFIENEGDTVTVATTFGTVTGTVITAGTDAAEILTPEGDILIIPYRSVETI